MRGDVTVSDLPVCLYDHSLIVLGPETQKMWCLRLSFNGYFSVNNYCRLLMKIAHAHLIRCSNSAEMVFFDRDELTKIFEVSFGGKLSMLITCTVAVLCGRDFGVVLEMSSVFVGCKCSPVVAGMADKGCHPCV